MKIISGGQTGVDQAALEAAFQSGLQTGGTAPKNYKTEKGSNYVLRDKYGLEESENFNYIFRTEQNIVDSNGTIIFYNEISGGTSSTIRLCKHHRKPCLLIDIKDSLDESVYKIRDWINKHDFPVINIAGHRESKCPGIYRITLNTLLTAFSI